MGFYFKGLKVKFKKSKIQLCGVFQRTDINFFYRSSKSY
jgi:hypothetical protein